MIDFEATVSDDQELLENIELSLKSDIDGEIGNYFADADGNVTGSLSLTDAEHTLTLTAIDNMSETDTDSVTLTVWGSNIHPSCEITSPENGEASTPGTDVTFSATISDSETDEEDMSVSWSSDLQGELNSSGADNGVASFQTAELETGTHTITIEVADDAGATASDSIFYTIGSEPEISWTQPEDGEVFAEGESISFRATVSDEEDDAADLTISWTSDVNGELNTTSPLSDGSLIFNESALAPGDHVIVLRVTDTDGLYTEEGRVISIQ